MNRAYILIGSNVQKKANYQRALRRLTAIGNVLAISSVYETAPIGNKASASFYNGAVLLETELGAFPLKRALRIIESQLGRVRTENPYAARTVDLDIVLFNHDTINDEDLHVPAPLVLQEAFVALPIAEISPQYVHPTDGRTLAEIARTFGKHPFGIRIEATATARAKQIMHRKVEGALPHARAS
ncbi:MAG: 2-amino-4-hydroxy-6-hydroxymethyldihydropteridine diphosphokinase [Chloroflexi bacterium]|nr:2-amino-4-hydroxy-6-hydroxymethyldihydropteridine diphosphokinase [Chloroflexota bacterium]